MNNKFQITKIFVNRFTVNTLTIKDGKIGL